MATKTKKKVSEKSEKLDGAHPAMQTAVTEAEKEIERVKAEYRETMSGLRKKARTEKKEITVKAANDRLDVIADTIPLEIANVTPGKVLKSCTVRLVRNEDGTFDKTIRVSVIRA